MQRRSEILVESGHDLNMGYIAYMGLRCGIRWLLDDEEIDARALALLAAIAERGSLRQAVDVVGLSYRHAWSLLGRLENRVGEALIIFERGRGARLTRYGQRVVDTSAALEARVAPELERAARALMRRPGAPARDAHAPLRVCASHDLALARFADLLDRRGTARLAVRFQGSVDALHALSRNECELAGFHAPADAHALPYAYAPWLKGRGLRVVHFADRRQGLMLAPGNPLRIATLNDLVSTRARFVNRQQGSGTRILFDSLVAAARLRPGQIHGYRHEEYTHVAVAAMVASGAADAGFGIEAAAAQQGLAFVPLAWERYYLAGRSTIWAKPAARALFGPQAARPYPVQSTA